MLLRELQMEIFFHKFMGIKMSDTSMEKGLLCLCSFYKQTSEPVFRLLILVSVL